MISFFERLSPLSNYDTLSFPLKINVFTFSKCDKNQILQTAYFVTNIGVFGTESFSVWSTTARDRPVRN